MTHKKTEYILIAICLILSLFGIIDAFSQEQKRKPHQLIYVESEFPSSLDTITSYQTSEIRLMELLFNSFVRKGDGGRTLKELVERYEIDGQRIRFWLRDGVTWKDNPGREERQLNTLHADDVMQTIRLLFANPDSISSPNLLIYLGSPNAVTQNQNDKRMIEFNLRQVPGRLENVFTFKILPLMFFRGRPELRLDYGRGLLYENSNQSFHQKPFGTGTYQVERYEGRSFFLVPRKHQNLLSSPPRLEQIEMRYEPDPNAALALLSQDRIDMVPEALPKSAEMFQDTSQKIAMTPYWNNQFYFIGFNSDGSTPKHRLFREEGRVDEEGRGYALRKAMSLATRKKKIMTEVYWKPEEASRPGPQSPANEAGIVSEGPLNRYNAIKNVTPQQNDPYETRLHEVEPLLDEYFDLVTYPKDDHPQWKGEKIYRTRRGSRMLLEFDLVYNKERGDLRDVAEKFRDQMKAIYIKINLIGVKKGAGGGGNQPDNWESRVHSRRDFDLVLDFYTFPSGTDDFTPLYDHYIDERGGEKPMRQNITSYQNSKVTQLIQKYRVETDPSRTDDHLQDLHNTLRDDYAMIYLFVLNTNAVYNTRVKNVEIQNYYFFKNIHNWDVIP